MVCSTPGFPVLHHLQEFAQTHVQSRWCHPTISSSASPFSSCSKPFPASESFPVSQLFASRGQNIGASVSTSVLPMTIQGWFLLGLTGLIMQSKGLSGVFWSSQFKNINSSAFCLLSVDILYGIHIFAKVHFCLQVNNVSFILRICYCFCW